MSLQELREQLAAKDKEIRLQADAFNKRKADGKTGADLWPAEAKKGWEELNASRDALAAKLKDEEAAADVAARSAELDRELRNAPPGGTPGRDGNPGGPDAEKRRRMLDPEQRAIAAGLALQAFLMPMQTRFQTEQHVEAARSMGIAIQQNQVDLDLLATHQFRGLQANLRGLAPINYEHAESVHQRAMSAFTGSAGGYMIPGGAFMGALEINMLAVGSVEQYADVITTATGEPMPWPTLDDTTEEGEMVGEFPTPADDADPTVGTVTFGSYEFSSGIVKIPNRLIDDSPQNVEAIVTELLGTRTGRASNRKLTVGTGNNQPYGIVAKAEVGKTTASATAITADEILLLFGSIDPVHRSSSGFACMCHNNIITQIRLLKDSNGQYIWKSGLAERRPDTIDGAPLAYNQHMDSALAASNDVLIAGDMKKYKVRRVSKTHFQRFVEKYVGAVGLLLMVRKDGNLLNAGTCPVKKLRMAAS